MASDHWTSHLSQTEPHFLAFTSSRHQHLPNLYSSSDIQHLVPNRLVIYSLHCSNHLYHIYPIRLSPNHSRSAYQTMSSSPSLTSDPSAPSNSHNLPCMFTVEQFQQADPSQGSSPGPSDVYIVRPTAMWGSLERFRRLVST